MVDSPYGLSRRALLPALGGLALPLRARAASYPDRPIRMIVGFPAGNSTDLVARIIGDALRVKLGQPIAVENRTGANGSLAATAVATATPDGYTLLMSNASTLTVNPLLYRDIRYRPLQDLVPVASVTNSPFIVTINPNNPRLRGVQSFQDLIALVKRKPGEISYGSPGNGNLGHVGTELLCASAGLSMLHVPYRGMALAQNALVAGDVDVVLDTPSAIPLIRAGTIRVLACAGATRWRDLPDTPTIVESGYPDVIVTFWNGLVATGGTPADIINTLAQAVEEVSKDAAVRPMLLAQGDVDVLGPAPFRERILQETRKNAETIRRANITVQ